MKTSNMKTVDMKTVDTKTGNTKTGNTKTGNAKTAGTKKTDIRSENTKTAGTKTTKKMVTAAFFLALGIVMPFLTGQIPGIGSRLLPMHIPVLLCGFVCGWQYGLLVGLVTPILRSAMFGMPLMMPAAVSMAFELAVYGAVTGVCYRKLPRKNASIYISLVTAMIAGRLVWGLVSIPLYGIAGGGKAFSWQMFAAGGFINAIPGIILQIVLIPVIVMALQRAKVLEHDEKGAAKA